jgi:hypothetical protein
VPETILEKLSKRGFVFSDGIPFTANQNLVRGEAGGGNMDGGGNPAHAACIFPQVPINMGDVNPEIALQHFMDQASMRFATVRDFIRSGMADYYFIGFRNLDSFTHWFQSEEYYDRLMDHLNSELFAFKCMGNDIELFVFSDHGSMPAHELFRLNLWLKENDYLDYSLHLENHERDGDNANYPDQIGPYSKNVEIKNSSWFINADAFDACIDVINDAVTEDDCKVLCERLMETGHFEWVKTREECWPGLSEEQYEQLPKIIPARTPGVLVSSNLMPGLPITGFTEHKEIVNARDGDHWTEGYYGCTVDIDLPDSIDKSKPEAIFHMIDAFCEPPDDEEQQVDQSMSDEDQEVMANALADMGYV